MPKPLFMLTVPDGRTSNLESLTLDQAMKEAEVFATKHATPCTICDSLLVLRARVVYCIGQYMAYKV